MYWADELVKKIPDKGKKHRVDDMKTVSGMPHVGSLRAVATHDIVYKAMKDAGFTVDFTYVFNDMDPMDGLPVYLVEDEYRQHMGKPLYQIPSPEKGYESFGKYYASKYKEAFNAIGCNPKIIWSHELYAQGKMDAIVQTALDNAEQIRKIYKKVADQDKPKGWLPYQVICPDCGKVGTTLVTDWDGTYVAYECKKDLVEWAVGCGRKGKIKPTGTNGKLMWKVDWPAHWKELGVTVEGAGKEHFTQGGSRDIGVHICKQVFKTNPPFGFLHEFFLVGGRKMSSSKGTGIGADKITAIIPAELVRYLIVRTPVRRAVNFDPEGMTIPDLYDDYDNTAIAYWEKSDKKLARIFELSQIKGNPPQKHFLPRFRDVATYIQHPEIDLKEKFVEIKGSKLSPREIKVLEERAAYANIWLNKFAPQEYVFIPSEKLPSGIDEIDENQRIYLIKALSLITKKWKEPEKLQQSLYEEAKKLGMSPKKAFGSIYQLMIGKNHGPRAAWFLLKYKDIALNRLSNIKKKENK